MHTDAAQLVFFLGGQDLEMKEIRSLLERHAPDRFHDRCLRWGARTSAYRNEIEACLAAGRVPVLVELEDDLGLDGERALVVDHHGKNAGRDAKTALEQVFHLLGIGEEEWTRWSTLVAANDRAYLSGLADVGATREEMLRVRAADRAAQGVTDDEERQAAAAAAGLDVRSGGRLTVARLPSARTSPLVDRLRPELGGPGFETLVVLSPGEVNVFAPGDVVRALDKAFPGGWYGGALPDSGFWGRQDSGEDVVSFLEDRLGGA